MPRIWDCKIGELSDDIELPNGADGPMREAVNHAYKTLTGREPSFIFSGWDGTLTDAEREALKPSER